MGVEGTFDSFVERGSPQPLMYGENGDSRLLGKKGKCNPCIKTFIFMNFRSKLSKLYIKYLTVKIILYFYRILFFILNLIFILILSLK